MVRRRRFRRDGGVERGLGVVVVGGGRWSKWRRKAFAARRFRPVVGVGLGWAGFVAGSGEVIPKEEEGGEGWCHRCADGGRTWGEGGANASVVDDNRDTRDTSADSRTIVVPLGNVVRRSVVVIVVRVFEVLPVDLHSDVLVLPMRGGMDI